MTISEINNHILFPIENKGFRDFTLICFGAERCASGKICHCMRDYYLIHFVLSGKGIFRSHNKEMKIDAGQAFIIRPGESFVYAADEKNPWVYTWIGFDGKLSSYFDNVEDVFDIDEEITDDLYRCMSMKTGREEYLAGILFKLCGKLFGEKPQRNKVKQVADFINANFMRDIKVSDIAEMLDVNRKYLVRAFKEKQGVTIREYIVEKRLSEGKKLLEKGKRVEEVGLMVGYSDGFAFSKAFKRQYGISPFEHKKFYTK
ncbi:MAG: AraC family transcriptional regulator [Ruminococcaceae bacterium]|nr:AraC family transcriptional regulator [Oscillospiraceae bacterium]